MDDQGEKIVFLAREILNASAQDIKSGKKPVQISMSFKTLCLTTLLAAAGGSLVTAWGQQDMRPLNRYEKTEIDALIFYVARSDGVDADKVRQDVEKKIGVASLDVMTANQFPVARRYLQEKAQ